MLIVILYVSYINQSRFIQANNNNNIHSFVNELYMNTERQEMK